MVGVRGIGDIMKDKNKYKGLILFIGISIICIIFIVVYGKWGNIFDLLVAELILIFGYVASVYDIKLKTIPNELILTMFGTWTFIIVLYFLKNTEVAISIAKSSVSGFILGGGLSFLVYLISRKGLGGGDVKFIAATGLYLGITNILSAMLYGTILAAITGLILISLKRIGRKDTMPLVPFLYIGILITIFYR